MQPASFLDSQHPIENKADADAYLARLEGFARALDQEIEVCRHDMGLGVTPPDFALAKTALQMGQLRSEKPATSNLVMSLVNRARAKKIAGDWAAPAAKIVADKVYPALNRQIVLVRQMQLRTRHDAGVWALPRAAITTAPRSLPGQPPTKSRRRSTSWVSISSPIIPRGWTSS